MNFEQFQAALESILAAIRSVIIGQEDAIRYSLVVILTNQHALIEGVPGRSSRALWPPCSDVSSSASSSRPT